MPNINFWEARGLVEFQEKLEELRAAAYRLSDQCENPAIRKEIADRLEQLRKMDVCYLFEPELPKKGKS
jgi:hypothetical protein